MKIHLPLVFLLAVSAVVNSASAAQYIPPGAQNIGSWSVIDTKAPLDVVTFYPDGQYIITPQNSATILASGAYQQSGTGLTLTISGSPSSGFGPKTANPAETFPGSGSFSFLDQVIDTSDGETPATASNGKPIVPSSPLYVGGTSSFSATVTDNGNSITIFSNSNVTFNRLVNGAGGQIILGAGGNGSSSGGNGGNIGNGSGNPTDPPGSGPGDPATAVPEPSTWAMLAGAVAGLLFFRRFRFGRR